MKRLARGTYLGGQQVAAILGMHPYANVGDVYELSVFGESTLDPNKPSLRRGRIMEPGLLEHARETDGVPMEQWQRDVFVKDKEVSFFAGTLDALATSFERPNGDTIYEVTTCSHRTLPLWGEEPDDPAKYKWIQSQWYMGLCPSVRRTRIFLFVTDTDEVREYTVPRSGAAIAEMRYLAEAFWLDHVLPKIPPRPDAFGILTDPQGASEVMDRIFRAAPGGRDIDATPSIVNAARAYAEAREAKARAEDEMAMHAALMKGELGDATLARFKGGRVSWTKNKASTKVDHEGLLAEVVKRFGVPDDALNGITKQFSTTRDGPRVLRVTLTK